MCVHIDVCFPCHSPSPIPLRNHSGIILPKATLQQYQSLIQIAFILSKPVGYFNGFRSWTTTSILEKYFSLNHSVLCLSGSNRKDWISVDFLHQKSCGFLKCRISFNKIASRLSWPQLSFNKNPHGVMQKLAWIIGTVA